MSSKSPDFIKSFGSNSVTKLTKFIPVRGFMIQARRGEALLYTVRSNPCAPKCRTKMQCSKMQNANKSRFK